MRLLSVLLVLVGPVSNVTAQSDPPGDLFLAEPTGGAALDGPGSGSNAVTVLRQRLVRVDHEILATARLQAARAATEPTALRLNLFEDASFTGLVESMAPSFSGGYSLAGQLAGVEMGTVTLVVNGVLVAGTVRTPEAIYRIRPATGGLHTVSQIELGVLPLEPDTRGTGGPRTTPGFNRFNPRRQGHAPHIGAGSSAVTVDHPANAAEDGSRIDLLVVYTPSARDAQGGHNAIKTLIDLFVAETNQALANSGAVPRFHLVHRQQVDYTQQPFDPDTGEESVIMNHLLNPSDGHMDEVHTLRDSHAADLVQLIVTEVGFPFCGEAKRLQPMDSRAAERYAFGVTRYDCGSTLFAHELGHAMGLNHDRYAEHHACCIVLRGREWNKPHPYSYGYVNQRAFEPEAPESSRWATIMSYSTQCNDAGFRCPTLLRFSNPNLSYNGDPTGVPGSAPSSSVTGPSDARRTLNELAHVVANFRRAPATKPPVPEPEPEPEPPGRTTPPTLDVTCHGYDEGPTRAYNCIPELSQQGLMGTFVPPVGSACDGGRVAEFPPGRIVFQIRCRDGSPGQSSAWSYSARGPASFVKPPDVPRVWVRTTFSGSSVHLSVWCRAPREHVVVNELLGTSWGNDGTNGIYGMAGCSEVEVDTEGQDLQWWFTQELAATALTPPRSWEHVTGADSALPAEALQDLAAAAELERLWGRGRLHPRQGSEVRGAVLTSDDDGGERLGLRIPSRPDDRSYALDGTLFRSATRTVPLTLDLTCHGYDEGATRAYNCIPEPSQQHHMRTFVPPVGSACDGGRIAEFPPGRIVFQIRCRDAGPAQSAAWSYSGRGLTSFAKPVDTPRVSVRTAFSGSSAHLSVWCRAPRESLVVNELLGASWGNDGTHGVYGMTGCREVEVDTEEQDLQWWFTQELAATALTPPRSWKHETGAGSALPAEARQDIATAAELERLWAPPAR